MTGASTPSQEEPRRGGGFLAFWTTLPGVLTGVAAVITAVVGLISYWHTTGSDSGVPTRQAAEQQGISPSSPSGQTPSSAATKTSSRASAVLAHGRLNLNRGDEADLEQGLIATTPTSDLIFGPETTPNLLATASALLAPSNQQPSKRICRTALTHRHDALEIITTLDTKWICVSTTEGHVAAVTVVRAPGVGNAGLLLGYTVWQ